MTLPATEGAKEFPLIPRVLVLRDNWLGCTGMSAFNAFQRVGCWADFISGSDYVPTHWGSFVMRALAKGLRAFAVREFNDALVTRVRALRPDLFFCVKGQWVTKDSLLAMRDLGCAPICYYPDLSFSDSGPYIPSALQAYEWIYTTKSFGVADLQTQFGIDRASFLPHAFDPDIHRPFPHVDSDATLLSSDVSFIGGWSRGKELLLTRLAQARPNLNLRIWGNRWENVDKHSPLRASIAGHTILGAGYAKAVSSSKINLALLQEATPGASQGDQITSRTFHIPACGGAMLHARTRDLLSTFVEDLHCACFEGIDELIAKVDSLLRDPETRKRLATNGRTEVMRLHSWDHRVSTVISDYCRRHSRT
jgi:hypothetical protein